MLLAFDTCLDKTYVGIGDNGTVIDTIIIENKGNTYHSAFLISSIKNILQKNNLTPKDITEVATDVGPGSFTGIRACMTVAKVMAQQLNIKTIGFSSLEIISNLKKMSQKTLVLLDARKNMAYVWDEEILGAIALEDVKEMVKADNYSIICDDAMYEIFSPLTSDIQSYTNIEHNFAEIMIKLSVKKQTEDWKKLNPLYIQPPPVFGK
ncbi:tRNA (adenosine(37)-N6)-threonylcarbamoyltransferase complex dimerization subunit type 1 TsaB [bacterium]|nr:tRNA (adenosine(37)-N6)-threonylcarbamoyltransferase complex dimerization subunit type 1 TsaB [bacterium]